MLRDAHVCIFNYLANLEMEKKYKPLVDVFVRLDFFFFFNKAKHFYITVKKISSRANYLTSLYWPPWNNTLNDFL